MIQERTAQLKGYGFEFDEADSYARVVVAELGETGISPLLGMLSLARAMVIIGGPRDLLDLACKMIDDFGDLPQPDDVELSAVFAIDRVDSPEEV